MAPKKTDKRCAPEDMQQPPTKKSFKGSVPADIPKYRPVLDAIDHPLAEEYPEACKQMLKAMVPSSLGIPAGERHPPQVMVVQMIGEVIEAVEAALQKAVASAEALVVGIEASRPGLDTKVQDADVALSAASAAEEARKAAHDLALQEARKAKAAVSDLQSAGRGNEASHKALSKEKETLELLLVCHVHYLKDAGDDGSWNAAEMKKHANHVIVASRKLPLEDSLAKSIPATVAKRPSERSSLDGIVFQQIEAYIQGRLQELDTALQQLAPELEKHDADLERSREDLEEKNKAAQLAASELKTAKAATKSATTARAQAVSAVEEYVPTRDAAHAARDAKIAEFAAFREGGARCYRELRGREEPADETGAAAAGQPEAKDDADEASKSVPAEAQTE